MNATKFEEIASQTSTLYHFVIGLVLLLTTSFSVFINSSILYLFLVKERNLLNRMNTYIGIVCLLAFIMTSAAVPMVIISSFAERWVFGLSGCVYYAFVTTLCGTATIFILTVFAADRYILVEFYCLDEKSTKCFSILSTAGSFVVSLILAICPLIGWNEYTYEGVGTACALDLTGDKYSGKSYLIVLLIMCFVLPVIIMLFCFTRIFFKVKQMIGLPIEQGDVDHVHQRYQMEHELAMTIIQIVAMFLFCWTPYVCIMVWQIVNNKDPINPIVASLPPMIAKTAGCFTPLVYLGRNRSIRKSVLGLYSCFRSTNTQHPATEGRPEGTYNEVSGDLQIPELSRSVDSGVSEPVDNRLETFSVVIHDRCNP